MSSASMYVEAPSVRSGTSEKKFTYNRKALKQPGTLQRIFHCKNQKCSLYYATKAKSVKPTQVRDVLQESTPFKFPADLEQFSFKVVQKAWKDKLQRKELRTKYCDRTNVRTRQTEDLLKRLYVEEPPELNMKTIMDIDKEFFTIVEARPLARRFIMAKYLENIRNVLRTKLMSGFRFDEILLIEEKLLEEARLLETIRKRHLMYLNSFEQFLNEDYDESMVLLREADLYALKTMEKGDQIKNMYTQLASLEFNVHKLEERWRDLKMYQKFLYFVSPMSWRMKYDYIHRKELYEDIETEPSTVFKKYTLSSQGHIPSLGDLVDEYMSTLEYEEPPVLYFTKPVELKKVFRFIEIQNLNCLLHTEEISLPMESMRASMEVAKKKFEQEAKSIKAMVSSLIGGIEWEERCAADLKATAMRLIDGTFRKLISDDAILKLYIFIEDVYESCVGPNDSDLDIYEMIVALEQSYNNLVLLLDGMPQHIVKKSEKWRFAEEARLNKLCIETAQKIALVESITWRLKKSLEPPFVRQTKQLIWRSAPPERPEKPPPPPRNLTEKEYEYLTYFTVYCKHTDNVADYGIDLKVPETDLSKFSVMNLVKK